MKPSECFWIVCSRCRVGDASLWAHACLPHTDQQVYECLVAGVPFLTHAVGGVPELIHPEDHDRVLVDGPNGKALARRILQVLQDGLRPARPWVRVALFVHLPVLVVEIDTRRGCGDAMPFEPRMSRTCVVLLALKRRAVRFTQGIKTGRKDHLLSP